MPDRIPLVVDTDTAADDCFALMLAATHPAADLRAVTIVAGNVDFDQQVHNAFLALETVGAAGAASVHVGARRPLVQAWASAEDVHGDGVGGQRREGEEAPSAEGAAQALVRLAREHAGELVVVAIGPLTNLALAAALDPDFAGNVREVVVMGGSLNGRGNITPAAEYNVYVDPEAAAAVLAAGFRSVRFVTWDPLTLAQGVFDAALIDRIAALGTPRSAFFTRANARTFDFDVAAGLGGSTHCDSIALLAAVDPGLVLEERPYRVEVELRGQHTRGATVFDARSAAPNATAIERIDRDRLVGTMLGMLAGG